MLRLAALKSGLSSAAVKAARAACLSMTAAIGVLMKEQTTKKAAVCNSGKGKKNSRFLSRSTVDILNSLSWFFMDAFWMLQFPRVCVCCIIPTAITGIALLLTNKGNKAVMLMDISTNCWIWMNFFWILQDMWNLDFMMPYVKLLTLIGIACLIAAVRMSDDLPALFSQFGPFRSSASYYKNVHID